MDSTSVRAAVQEVFAHWAVGTGPKEYGQYLLNKRGYSRKRTNRKHNHK